MVKNECFLKVNSKNLQKFKKPIDFHCIMCYNKDTKKKE